MQLHLAFMSSNRAKRPSKHKEKVLTWLDPYFLSNSFTQHEIQWNKLFGISIGFGLQPSSSHLHFVYVSCLENPKPLGHGFDVPDPLFRQKLIIFDFKSALCKSGFCLRTLLPSKICLIPCIERIDPCSKFICFILYDFQFQITLKKKYINRIPSSDN